MLRDLIATDVEAICKINKADEQMIIIICLIFTISK